MKRFDIDASAVKGRTHVVNQFLKTFWVFILLLSSCCFRSQLTPLPLCHCHFHCYPLLLPIPLLPLLPPFTFILKRCAVQSNNLINSKHISNQIFSLINIISTVLLLFNSCPRCWSRHKIYCTSLMQSNVQMLVSSSLKEDETTTVLLTMN